MKLQPRARRAVYVVGVLCAIALAVGLVLNALRTNLVFFFTPTQVAAHEAPRSRAFRIGGLVEQGSLRREGSTARFSVTDMSRSLSVVYTGILPDLFREGRGVVVQGHLSASGVFEADQVLAKHDENYMPPEAAEALKAAAPHPERMARSAAGEPPP